MTITITDPALIEAFRRTTGDVLVTDPSGEVLCSFTPNDLYQPPPGFKSPISDEEWERRRQDKTPGRSLNEILRDLEARG